MDVAYKQHASQARRKNRSSTNLNHLTLAPLTSKLPLHDDEDFSDVAAASLQHNTSYLQGKSAPTTPRLLSRSPARTTSRSRRASIHAATTPNNLPKSKSASHLTGLEHLSPVARRRNDGLNSDDDCNDSDWMLRAGALISTETRESKGQAWLVSRASTTSLSGMRDAEEEAFEREIAREKELASRQGSRRGSRRGSFAAEDVALTSRSHSRAGSKAMIRTPSERHTDESYFDQHFHQQHYTASPEEYIQGPDFVSLDEKLEAIEIDTSQADEATIRKLVKRDGAATSSWMGNIIGFSLFSVDEHEEDSDNADGEVSDGEGEGEDVQLERSASTRHFEGVSTAPEPRIPPPKADEGGWQDAAWLLSVASKVLL